MSSDFKKEEMNKNKKQKITPSLIDIFNFPISELNSFIKFPSLIHDSKENINNNDLGITPENKKSQILNKEISTNIITPINSKNEIFKNINSNEEKLFLENNSKILFNISKENINKKPSLTSLESKNFLEQYKEKTKFLPYDELLKFQEDHLLIPIDKMNNERFKILSIQKLKDKKKTLFKSAKKFIEDENNIFQKAIEKVEEYALLKKKKIVYSTKKDLFIFIPFYNKNFQEKKFPLFKDKDIGIYEYWQAHIQNSEIDEDFDSEDEQIELAQNYCLKEMKESINNIKNYGLCIVSNLKYFKNKK
jgi:hypothetical protein